MDATLVTIGMFVFSAIMLFFDYLLKKCYKPYLQNKLATSDVFMRVGIFSTVSLKTAFLEKDAKANSLKTRVKRIITSCFEKVGRAADASKTKIEVVINGSDIGVSNLAFAMAKGREWKTKSYTSKEEIVSARQIGCDVCHEAGAATGDECSMVTKHIDMLILIGNGDVEADDPYEKMYEKFSGMKFRFDASSNNIDKPKYGNVEPTFENDEDERKTK